MCSGMIITPFWKYRSWGVPYTVYCVMIPFGTAGDLQDTSTTDTEARRAITSLGGVGAGGGGGGEMERKHTHTLRVRPTGEVNGYIVGLESF